ncbi:class I SAM-dependent methyltransferase [Giesbergeria anulus]|uniref:Methyltransferase domain-containing protein n=1 Tax=Giesbergeria anulus TaxID=180197 RepID=A0A1H9SQY5_9BURK|nr:class I SAM-dependent methyltransferase [Giesbergeria anulus]SER87225.1 Methyltransferase domain-containing protein [Giesbergeria anulus]
MSYFENVNPDLLAEVKSDAKRICEFGCGAGALARAIKSINPSVHYVGVEIAEDPLLKAKDVLDVAIQRNLDLIPSWRKDREMSGALHEASFDHVIFGDVLEHLYDPESAVQQAVEILSENGTLLACIPNVQHWSVFTQLVIGSWPRVDAGIFDRTHIRWFTLHDMVNLMQKSGLVVEKIVPRIFQQEQGIEIMEYLEPLAIYLGVDSDSFLRQGLPLQYILVAKRIA